MSPPVDSPVDSPVEPGPAVVSPSPVDAEDVDAEDVDVDVDVDAALVASPSPPPRDPPPQAATTANHPRQKRERIRDHYTADVDPARARSPTHTWIEKILGRDVLLEPLAGGTMADVFAVHRTDEPPCAALKVVRSKGTWTRECAALRLADGLGDGCPRLLAASADLCAIAMTWIPGVEPTHRVAAWRGAGEIRRSLDAVAVDDDPMPLDRALAKRFAGWMHRARTVLPSPTCAAIEARFDATIFAGRARRLCHRDFGPHNWRIDRDRVRCVDLGHARVDDPLVDLVHATVPPHDTPAHVDAFASGWRVTLDDATWQCIRQLALLHGLATTTWGHLHRAPRFVALGDAILARSISTRSPWFVEQVGCPPG